MGRPFCKSHQYFASAAASTQICVYINNKFLFGCNDFAQLLNPGAPHAAIYNVECQAVGRDPLRTYIYVCICVYFAINDRIHTYICIIYIGSTESRQTRVALTKPVGNGLANGIYCNGVLKTKSSSSNQIQSQGYPDSGGGTTRTIDTLSPSSFNIYAHLAGHFFHAKMPFLLGNSLQLAHA